MKTDVLLLKVTKEIVNPCLWLCCRKRRFLAPEPLAHIPSSWLNSIKLKPLTSVCDKSDFHLVNPDKGSLQTVLAHHGQPSWGLTECCRNTAESRGAQTDSWVGKPCKLWSGQAGSSFNLSRLLVSLHETGVYVNKVKAEAAAVTDSPESLNRG